MKILFCIKALNNPGGGAERVFADVATELHRKGHDLKVLTFERPGGTSFYSFSPDIERLDLAIGNTTRNARPLETVRRLLALRQTILKEQPGVAVGFMHSMFIPLSVALAGTGIPVIASEHIVPAHYRKRPLQRAILGLSPLFVTRFTAVSGQARDSYPDHIRSKMSVVNNPVPPIKTAPTTADFREQARLFLSVGRLNAQKDHLTLIKAFGKVVGSHPDWKLRIVGDGELRSVLERQITQSKLEPYVDLLPSTPDIGDHYAAATALVQPSLYESFGLTAAEALSTGLPVIAFADCQGLNELVSHEQTGLLVEDCGSRVDDLAGTLERFISDQELRRRLLTEQAKLPSMYDIDSVGAAWESLLHDMVSEPRGASTDDHVLS